MRSSIIIIIVFFFAAALLAVSSVFLSFSGSGSSSASAYPHPLLGNPHNAGMGIVGMSMLSTSYSNCNIELPAASPDKWGESVTFKVPPGVADVVRAGEPDKPANYHIAFEGDDGLYYEVGIYYGDWSRDSGIGYNATRFQMAWGIGGILRGTSSAPVVAGHTLELSILYGPDKKWQVRMDDLDDSRPAQTVDIGRPSMKVKSDYFTFVEAGSFAPNTNTQRLGLVEVLNIQYATKATGSDSKVELSAWTGGYLLMNCSPANSNYGVTYLGSTGRFKIGYEGATTKNGHQFW